MGMELPKKDFDVLRYGLGSARRMGRADVKRPNTNCRLSC